MNFDDFLDMVSVFSDKGDKQRKVAWAFKIYGELSGIDGKNNICYPSIVTMLDTTNKVVYIIV